MKKKLILFTIVFCIATLITSPNFVPSHGLDSYCNIYGGYESTAIWFLQKGRVIGALMFYIYSLINLPFDCVGMISALGVNLCLTGAIFVVYNYLSKNIDNKYVKLSILTLAFTMFYMPLMIEIVMFDEGMVMCFGILMTAFCAKEIARGGIKHYLLALLFMILSVCSYQGVASFLVPILLLFIAKDFKNNNKDEVICLIKKLFIAALIYGIAFVSDFGVMKIAESIFGSANGNIGYVNIKKNIYHIFTFLLPNGAKELFGYIKPSFYYLLVFISLIFAGIGIFKNSNKLINIMFLILLIASSFLMPFVPNLAMNSEENYMAARTILTLTILPSVICLITAFKFNFDNKYFMYILLLFALCLMAIYSYLFYKNLRIDLRRYSEDVGYLKQVNREIEYYEKTTDKKVKHIYYAFDTDRAYYYPTGYNNGANIRVMAEGWAMKCAVNDYIKKDYKITYEEMPEDIYNKYFKDKNYKKFDTRQFKFDGDKLYLLIY